MEITDGESGGKEGGGYGLTLTETEALAHFPDGADLSSGTAGWRRLWLCTKLGNNCKHFDVVNLCCN